MPERRFSASTSILSSGSLVEASATGAPTAARLTARTTLRSVSITQAVPAGSLPSRISRVTTARLPRERAQQSPSKRTDTSSGGPVQRIERAVKDRLHIDARPTPLLNVFGEESETTSG